VRLRVTRSERELALAYAIEGDVGRMRLPAREPPRAGERLWEHTCCEAFIRRQHAADYHELNFSPSGAWAVHAFTRYREGGALTDQALDPRVSVCIGADRLELLATVALDRLDPRYAHDALALAFSAVIEDEEGSLSYWALAHPAGAPDFHHEDAFAFELPAAARSEGVPQ
jgi:hypothetical protein